MVRRSHRLAQAPPTSVPEAVFSSDIQAVPSAALKVSQKLDEASCEREPTSIQPPRVSGNSADTEIAKSRGAIGVRSSPTVSTSQSTLVSPSELSPPLPPFHLPTTMSVVASPRVQVPIGRWTPGSATSTDSTAVNMITAYTVAQNPSSAVAVFSDSSIFPAPRPASQATFRPSSVVTPSSTSSAISSVAVPRRNVFLQVHPTANARPVLPVGRLRLIAT